MNGCDTDTIDPKSSLARAVPLAPELTCLFDLERVHHRSSTSCIMNDPGACTATR